MTLSTIIRRHGCCRGCFPNAWSILPQFGFGNGLDIANAESKVQIFSLHRLDMSLEATPPVILREIIAHLDGQDMVNLVLAFPALNPSPQPQKVEIGTIDAEWLADVPMGLTRTEEDMRQQEIDDDRVHLNEPIPPEADLFSIVDYSTTVGGGKGSIEVELDAPCINMYAKGDDKGWRLDMIKLRATPKSSKTRMQSEIRYNLSGQEPSKDTKGRKIHRFWSYDKKGDKIDWNFSFPGDNYCEYKLTDDKNQFMYGIIKNEEGDKEGVWAVSEVREEEKPSQDLPTTHVRLSEDTSENAIIKLVGSKCPLVIMGGGEDEEANGLYYVDWEEEQTHHIADISLDFFKTDDWLLNIPCVANGEELFVSLDGCILRLQTSPDGPTHLVRKYDTPQFNQGELALDQTKRFLFSWTPERQAVLDLDTERLTIILPYHRYVSRFVGIINDEVHVWRFNWGYIKDVFDHKRHGKEEYDFSEVEKHGS
jgi:hypothetical protein